MERVNREEEKDNFERKGERCSDGKENSEGRA